MTLGTYRSRASAKGAEAYCASVERASATGNDNGKLFMGWNAARDALSHRHISGCFPFTFMNIILEKPSRVHLLRPMSRASAECEVAEDRQTATVGRNACGFRTRSCPKPQLEALGTCVSPHGDAG
jgi:hypothetical protein